MRALLIGGAAAFIAAAAPDSVPTSDQRVDMIARALVELNEAAGLGLSPSGRWAVYEVRRADPDANTYHAHWEVLDLTGRGAPRTIADGGDMPFGAAPANQQQMAVWVSLQPRWSPDENWIAYLRRDGAETQIWRARIDGSRQEQVSRAAGNVVDFVWSDDGRALIYDAGPSRDAMRHTLESERLTGFLFDDRFDPVSSWEPIRTHGEVADPPCCQIVDVDTHTARNATPAEVARFNDNRPRPAYQATPGMAHMWTLRAQGAQADLPALHREPALVRWRKIFAAGAAVVLAFADPSLRGASAPVRLYARGGSGEAFVACPDVRCAGWLSEAWRAADGDIIFSRREGWAFSTFAFYRWRPSTGAVRQLVATHDIFYDCNAADERLLCFTEGSVSPQTLVSIDFATGVTATLLDLNLDFDRRALAPAGRLEWRSPLGHEDYGYFVRPLGPKPERGFPLVITHYRARGFLRGGTGDFSPIQAYAAAGIAVLAVDRPEDWDATARETDDNEIERRNFDGLRLRADVFGALNTALDALIARGDVDASRIGISGLSDGSASTAYAIAHTHRFRAASLSGGAWEPILYYMSSPRQRALYSSWGLGLPGSVDDRNWSGLSMSRNAANITTPLLIQTADSELGMALEPFTTLQANNKPVEMYIYSNEMHVPWQPAHRLAMYRRNIDWFRFWLQGYADPDPRKADQYNRWGAMRDGRPAP